MSLYSKALRHINMDRVKELREENIKKQKLAEEKLQEEILRAHVEMIRAHYSKHYDWRSDLIEEGMTTSGMGMINLEPTGENVTSINSDQASIPGFTNDGTLSGGTWTMNNAPDPENAAVTIALTADLSRFDTITPSVAFNNATIDPAHGMDLVFNGPSGSGLSHVVSLAPGSSGFTNGIVSFPINIPSNLRIKGVTISYTVIGNGGEEGDRFIGSNAIRITSTIPNRRRPMNVLVSLDDPEATAFIRDTLGNENLSPAQKKKKLEQMLGASAEYLTKMFGEGIFTGATELSDVELQQSFAQIAANQVDLTPLSDNPYGTEIAQVASTKLSGMGINPDTATPSILAAVLGITMYAATELRKGLDALQSVTGGYPDYGADAGPTTTGQSLPGVGENTPAQQAEIDAANQEISDARQALNDAEDSGNQTAIDMARERLNRANNRRAAIRRRNRNQRNLPGYQGESVIHEKKKLKSPASLLDKIPGYYDGKPAPLGFPIEEPPKMKNGMHPNLVDGKKVANRYNRLDPTSAKAMPKTGNPHIDRKVKAAAKNPK